MVRYYGEFSNCSHCQGRLKVISFIEDRETIRKILEHLGLFLANARKVGFRRNLGFSGKWKDPSYSAKQAEAYVVKENGWREITVFVKFFCCSGQVGG